jgi:hypothetical protein
MPDRLNDLLISEVSAVDDPANQSPGWLLMKRRSRGRSAQELGKVVDAMLAIGKINDAIVAKGDTMRADELQSLATSLLELFATLTPDEKRRMLTALDANVGKALRNAFLLAQATADVPSAEDGVFALALRGPVMAR